MARSKPKSESAGVGGGRKKAAQTDLAASALAAELARLDRQWLQLMQDRAKLAIEAAKSTSAAGSSEISGASPGNDPLGSNQLGNDQIEQMLGEVAGPLPLGCVKAIAREFLSGCRSMVRETRIAFLGPLYTYSHLAAIHRFGQSVEFVPVATIAAVFEEVHRGHSNFGLVPVENSTDGRVADTLDMFTRLPVRISGEIDLKIHHFLLGKCPRTEVKEVYSRPQALSQCRNWLAKHAPLARTIEVTSTSTAAQLATEKPGAAAIAGIQAGVHYGLQVLAENIEDNPGNITRFAVIGGPMPERTGNDRTAMLFQVEHRPGALAEAMNIFKRYRLNLTWIESFPIPLLDRSYLFFVEMEAHQSETRFRKALAALKKKALRLEILGSFPAATVVE
jgi:chorismate mutase/prephenate dehydratase